MRLVQFTFPPNLIDAVNPESLCMVHKKQFSGGGWIEAPFNVPASPLFAGMDLVTVIPDYLILRGNTKSVRVEKSLDGGCKYVWFNNEDRNKATEKALLVTGDPARDAVNINIILDTIKRDNGIITIMNNAIVNGMHWKDFQGNQNLNNLGWQYSLNNLADENSFSGLVYLPAGGRNFNQFGSKREYINITTNEEIPISTDKTGNSQIETHADYIISRADILDGNIEKFGVKAVWSVGGSPKNEATQFLIDAKILLQ